MSEEDKCLRCGSCCYWVDNGKRIKCRFLMKVGNNKHFCRIYANRLYKKLGNINGKDIICNLRENRHENIYLHDGTPCPYNCKEWETINIKKD